MAPYEPVSCSLHDHYEAAAVRRQAVHIRWNEAGEAREHQGLITDIDVRDGAEFMVLDGAVRVRLDRIEDFSVISG